MAKDFWENDKPAASDEFWKADKPEAQRDLPVGAEPSRAGGGRGSVNPSMGLADAQPSRAQRIAEMDAASDPMGTPAPRRESVLEGTQMPEPQFDLAEGERLSSRKNAEASQPTRDRQTAAPIVGKTIPINEQGTLGRSGSLIGSQLDAYSAGLGYKVADAAAAVGATGIAANLKSRANNLQERSDTTEKSISLSADGAFEKYAPQILAVFPTMAVAGLTGSVIPAMFGIAEVQAYAEGRKAGLSPGAALPRSMSMGAAEAIGEMFGGTGKLIAALEKAVVKGGSLASLKELSGRMAASGLREVPSEEATYAMQFGIDKLSGIGLKPEAGIEDFAEGAKDTAIVAAGAGGAMAGSSMAVSKMAAPQREARIKQLRDAGETGVADLLQKRHDTQSAAESVDTELAQMPGNPEFQASYRQMRTAGIKPAEAAARSAVTISYQGLAATVGIPEKAAAAALEKAATLPLDQVPGFFAKFTAGLASRGLVQPFDGMDGMAAGLEAARDDAIEAAMGAAYQASPEIRQSMDDVMDTVYADTPAATMADIEALELHKNSSPTQEQINDPSSARIHAANGGRRSDQFAGGSRDSAMESNALDGQAETAAPPGTRAVFGDRPDGPLENGDGISQRDGSGGLANNDSNDVFVTGNDVLVTPETDSVHTAATSPLNDLPEPTQAQKEAGNYKLGRLRIADMDIAVENPQGSVRRGTDTDGNPWESRMRQHYGYFNGTTANDGDKLDVFVQPGIPEDFRGAVYVVDQIDPRTGKLDEHKVLIGPASEEEARAMYASNYDAGWQGLGAITRLPLPAFKAWAKSGTLKEPLGEIQIPQATAQKASTGAAPAPDSATGEVQPATGGAAVDTGAPEQRDGALKDDSAIVEQGQSAIENVASRTILGRNNVDILEGGKPFKTRLAAAPSQAAPEPAPAARAPQGKQVSFYPGKYGKGMGKEAAKLEAMRLNRGSTDKSVTFAAEEHNDPKLENPWAVVGRKDSTSKQDTSQAVPAHQAIKNVALEPWQMTRAEYTGQQPTAYRERVGNAHMIDVARAVRDGKDVPSKVLADYPNLNSDGTQETPISPAPVSEKPVRKQVEKAAPGGVNQGATLPPTLSAKLQEAHKAHGRDVTLATVQRMYDRVMKTLITGKGSNGGVQYDIKPKERKELQAQADRLTNDLSLFGARGPVYARGGFDADAFSRMFRPPTAMAVSDVQKAVNELSAKWRSGPVIKVVATPADLPIVAPADARGLIHNNGTAYVVARNHINRDGVAKTLGHEAVGHYGLWRILGTDGVKQFNRNLQLAIKSGNVPLGKIRDKVRKAYVDERGKFNLSPLEESSEIAAFAVEDAIDPVTGEFKPGFGFMKQVWAKVAEFLRSLGIDIKFTNLELHGMLVAAMRGLEAGHRLDGGGQVMVAASRTGEDGAEFNALKALSQNDELFSLPKSDKATVEAITAEVSPDIKVKKEKDATGRTMYTFTMPGGKTATMSVRPFNPYATEEAPTLYGYELVDGFPTGLVTERPGTNPEDVPPTDDVWVDVSKLKTGSGGAQIYNIAETYAHNTGKMFIGDPAGLSDEALRRRTELMLSSALKFGTTEHLAPHPRQVEGDSALGIPPLKWTYGDDLGNIRSLLKTSLANYTDVNPLTFEPSTGRYLDSEGNKLDADAIRQISRIGRGREVGAGRTTLQRGAVFESLVREGRSQGSGGRQGAGLLERLVELAREHGASTRKIFYARGAANVGKAAAQARGTNEAVTNPKDVVGNTEKARAADGTSKGASVDESTGLPMNADGTVTVYHHTSKAAASTIRETGILKAQAEPHVYVTSRKDADTGYGDTVVALRVRPDQLTPDDEFPNGRKDFSLSVGKPGGSIKVDVVGNNQGGRSADDSTPGAAIVDDQGNQIVVYHGRNGDRFRPLELEAKATELRKEAYAITLTLREKYGSDENGYKTDLWKADPLYKKLQTLYDDAVAAEGEYWFSDADLKGGEFDVSRSGDVGIHFATDPSISSDFAKIGAVFPLHLNAKTVVRVSDIFSRYQGLENALDELEGSGVLTQKEADKLRSTAEKQDAKNFIDERDWGQSSGVISFWKMLNAILSKKESLALVYHNEVEGGGDSYVVFNKNQIRSAIGIKPNEPTAPESGGAIAFARGTGNLFQPNIWNTPDATRTDKVIYELQDQKIDLKRVQEAIAKSGQQITEQWDARLAETLYPGRVAYRSATFLEVEAKPLLEAMARNKVPMDELADYLHARGAEERNAQIAKVNPNMPDGGAGTNSKGVLLTDQAARDYLEAVRPARKVVLDAMAKRVDTITAGTRTLLVTEGLEKQDTIDAWTSAYKNYVPMFRDEAEGGLPPHPQGSGFQVKGSASKRATGSTKEVTNILAHVLMQREAAITRAEKNRVALALYGQALSHPNPDFWTTIKPGMKAAEIAAELVAMGVDPLTAEVGMERAPTIRTVSPLTGKVVDTPNPMYRNLPGAIPLKVNGADRVLMLNVKTERGQRLAESLKNLDGLTQLDLAGSIIGKSTRWLAAVNTQYNPAFGLVNLTRDTLGGAINLGSTELRGNALKVLAKTPMAILGIARELAGGGQTGKWQALYRQFQADGGQTGFKENFRDPNDRAKAVEKELKSIDAAKLSPGRAAHAILDLLDGFNTTLENAVRLSAYSAALDKGISRANAARLGRELTVDFNRKGRAGREAGPLYAFFNASVQGGARTIQALKGPTGGRIIAGGLSLGILQALMLAAAGYDDDEIPEFIKTRALIIPLFGHEKNYIAIPYPLGLHVLPNTGRVLAELTLNGGKDIGKRSVAAIGEIAGAFNPLGSGNIFTADGALKTVAPTLIDPIIELSANKNFAGGTIEKTGFGGEPDNRPGIARTKESTQRSTTGQVYMAISKAINTLTGGTDYEAGLLSPTPERVRYLAQTVGGGVLREVEKTINSITVAARGEKVRMSGIPVAGRFYGEVDDDQVQTSRYFDSARKMRQIESSVKAATKAGDVAAADKIEDKNPEAALIRTFNRTQRSISALNKEAVQTIGDRKELVQIDKDRAQLMRDFNQDMEELEREAGKVTLSDRLKTAVLPKVAENKR